MNEGRSRKYTFVVNIKPITGTNKKVPTYQGTFKDFTLSIELLSEANKLI